MFGEQVLHHVRRLRAVIDGHALLALVPVGDNRTRFIGHAGVASKNKSGFDHRVSFRESRVDGADVQFPLEAKIVAKRSVDDRRFAIESRLRIGDGRQLLVTHVDQFTSVLSLRACTRDDGANSLTLPAGAVDRDRRLRRRFEALQMSEHANPRRHDFGEFGTGHDRNHARRFFSGLAANLDDTCMSVRRPHISNMGHARQRYVAHILSPALRQPLQIRPRHRAADVRIWPV